MKTIGLIGGMSWESTLPYYRRVNEGVRERLGGLHSARILLYSFDFDEIERLQRDARWDEAGVALADAARRLERAGADLLVLCTNTMHRCARAIESAVSIPLLHIADATGAEIRRAGLHTVGLLATRFTMEQDFYRARLQQRHGIATIVPDERGREAAHRIIYEELCRGVIRDESRECYRGLIRELVERGAEAVIFGCTEIGLLLGAADSPVPVFDTTAIHAAAAVAAALPATAGAASAPGPWGVSAVE